MSKKEINKLLTIKNISKTLSTRHFKRKQFTQTKPLEFNVLITQVINMPVISEQQEASTSPVSFPVATPISYKLLFLNPILAILTIKPQSTIRWAPHRFLP